MSDGQNMPDVIYANKDQDCYREGKWQDFPWAYMPNDFTLIDAPSYPRCDIDPADAVVVSKQLGEDIGDDQRDSEATIATLTAERDALVEALKKIAAYGFDGVCPYGCDTPDIARTALAQLKEQDDE